MGHRWPKFTPIMTESFDEIIGKAKSLVSRKVKQFFDRAARARPSRAFWEEVAMERLQKLWLPSLAASCSVLAEFKCCTHRPNRRSMQSPWSTSRTKTASASRAPSS